MESPHIALHTCGACPAGNPGRGGYAAIAAAIDGHQITSGGFRATTNNRIELHAALAGLAILPTHSYFTIYSHSRYLVDAIEGEWIPRWIQSGWVTSTGAPVLNRDLWVALNRHLMSRTIHARWISKEATPEYLKRCLREARSAADSLELPPDAGFERDNSSRPYVNKWNRWVAKQTERIKNKAAVVREIELTTLPAKRTVRRRPRAD